MAKKETQETKSTSAIITIEKPNMVSTTIRVRGTTPLIVHAWSHKAKEMMLKAQQETSKVKKKGHEVRLPMEDYLNAAYWIGGDYQYDREMSEEENYQAAVDWWNSGHDFGIPAKGLKACATSGAYRAGLVKNQVVCRAAFFIEGIGENSLLPIHTSAFPRMREDTVRVGMGTTDLRYRPQFDDWYVDVPIKFMSSMIDLQSIINMFMIGGVSVGMCEDRCEKGGNYGSFTIEPIT